MRRRDFVKAIITSAAGWPLPTRAQQRTTPVSPVLGQPTMDGIIVKELFGVSHPDQILMLSAALNPATQKLMKDGTEVSYQVDGSKILVRSAGGIAANSTHVWTIAPGARSAAAQVSVTDGGTYYEIDNGLVAFRTPKTIPITTPANLWPDDPPLQRTFVYAPDQVLAPIQGIRHRDGTWTGTGPNYLYSGVTPHRLTTNPTWGPEEILTSNFPAVSAVVDVRESGPLRAKIRISYTAARPAWGAFSGSDWNQASYPSDTGGYFICTLTLEAGQQVIFVEQETDGRPTWSINMNNGVNADRARYRGQGASSIAQGHNYDGTIYELGHARGERDAEVNLADIGTRSGYDWASSNFPAYDGVWYPKLYQWYTWDMNSGFFWIVYNSAGNANSNAWAMFQGPSSFYRGGYAGINFGMYGKPASGALTEHGIYSYLTTNIGRADNPEIALTAGFPSTADSTNVGHQLIPRKASFGIFLGSKGVDIPVDFSTETTYGEHYGPLNQSGIIRPFNLHSGTAQLWKQIDQVLDFPDPIGGFPGMYLSRNDTEALISAVQNNTNGIYDRLYNQDPYYRRVWQAFNDVTNVKANDMVQWTIDYIRQGIEVYVNAGDVFSMSWFYWEGATKFSLIAVNAQAALSLNQVRPFLTGNQKRQLKAALSTVGHIMWDNDFVPIDNWQNFTLGTANMPVQFTGMRNQLACLLKEHSQFSSRFAGIYAAVEGTLGNILDSYGSPKDCPHYSGALITTTIDLARQLQLIGQGDLFATNSSLYSRLVVLGEWHMQILSPKQSRFGRLRKMFAFGDGASEGNDNFLSLIMGFENSNPTLAQRMARAWADMGQPMVSFYGSSGLKIRPNFPTQDMALGDADFPGYMTVMRSGWNTVNESAVIVPHGDSLVDHSTFQRGSPSIYLLGAPVCISYGSMYATKVNGPWVSASVYIPNSQLGYYADDHVDTHTWDTATDLNFPCGIHQDYIHDTYVYTPTTNRVDLTMTFAAVYNWVRHITYYRDVISAPVVRLRDSNTEGGDAIFTLHMMAKDAVTKPDGSTITPTTLTGTPFSIANGACFKFVGQWGVSWDVYYFGPSAQAFIGYWGHTWAPSGEASEYQAATGQPFSENQYILRIKTAGPCDVVVVPYFTGKRPANLKVVQVAGGLRVDPASRTLAN
jgi:hypothetical protein